MKKIVVTVLLICCFGFILGCGGTHPPIMNQLSAEDECGLKDFKRLNYYSGKLLTVRDFESEQSYFREKGYLHNYYLHGVGVICGLIVSPAADRNQTVVISPGIALDAGGREIVIEEATKVSLNDYRGDVFIILEYKESLIEATPVPGNDSTKHNFIREEFVVKVIDQLPNSFQSTYDLLNNVNKKDRLQFLFDSRKKCCQKDSKMPVVLARVHLSRWSEIRETDIDNLRHRNFILTANDMLHLF